MQAMTSVTGQAIGNRFKISTVAMLVAVVLRIVELERRGAARRAAPVPQPRYLMVGDADQPFIRAALVDDLARQPRPCGAVTVLFLLRSGEGTSTRLSLRNRPSLQFSSYRIRAPFRWSRADNLCGYHLRAGLLLYWHIWLLSWVNS
jgi:hypothetical protein